MSLTVPVSEWLERDAGKQGITGSMYVPTSCLFSDLFEM